MPNVQRISLHYNNVYVVDGGGVCVLIDTGPDYRGAWAAIESALDGRRPDLVVASHGHLDHAGLGRRWQESGVPVAIHADDVHLATATQLQAPEDFGAMAGYARGSGAPTDVADAAVAGLEDRRRWAHAAATQSEHPPASRNSRWPTGLRYRTFSPERSVSDEDDLLGLAGLEVHHMPGHTPGNVVVTCRAEGWLFSGDQLLPEFTPTPAIQFTDGQGSPERFRSLPEFVASMKRIDGVALLKCFPGHGEPFEDVHGAVTRNLFAISERTERVLSALRKAGWATIFELCEATYPRAARRRYWQVVATIQGNLDVAEDAGAVHFDGTRYECSG